MELIKVSLNAEGQSVVSARELYAFLGVTERFVNWCERMFAYGFAENQDFTSVKFFTLVNNGAKRYLDDYALTLDCAKQISMLQRNERGKQARQYFIDCETKLKAVQANVEFLPEALQTTIQEMIQKNNLELKIEMSQEFVSHKDMDKIIERMDEGLHNFFDWLMENVFKEFEKRLDKLEGKFEHISDEKLADLELCYVYFLREGDTDIFKIGFSIGTKERIQKLSTGNSKKLTPVWQIPFKNTDSAKAFEDFLKVFFKAQHVKGEWYKLTYHDFEYIQRLAETQTTHLENMFKV